VGNHTGSFISYFSHSIVSVVNMIHLDGEYQW